MSGHPHNWLFTQEELDNSPSQKCGIDADKELSYRQLTANMISDMAKKLHVFKNRMNKNIGLLMLIKRLLKSFCKN